jgi:hypothetical protein
LTMRQRQSGRRGEQNAPTYMVWARYRPRARPPEPPGLARLTLRIRPSTS